MLADFVLFTSLAFMGWVALHTVMYRTCRLCGWWLFGLGVTVVWCWLVGMDGGVEEGLGDVGEAWWGKQGTWEAAMTFG